MGTSKMKIFDSSILFFLLRHICAKGFRPCTKENVSLTPVRLVVFGRRNGLTKCILIQTKSNRKCASDFAGKKAISTTDCRRRIGVTVETRILIPVLLWTMQIAEYHARVTSWPYVADIGE